MPNGISCLFFAGKNLIYGKKENNLFKEGIGVIQTVRGADFIASAGSAQKATSTVSSISTASVASAVSGGKVPAIPIKSSKNPIFALLGESAKVLKKILYPLFIVSGAYNTIKSDDKVKTGTCQASGIGLMYAFEQFAEKSLVKFDKLLNNKNISVKSKPAKLALYAIKGMVYAGASMFGYTTGNKIAEKSVDSIRHIKQNKKIEKEIFNDFITSQQNTNIEAK